LRKTRVQSNTGTQIAGGLYLADTPLFTADEFACINNTGVYSGCAYFVNSPRIFFFLL